MTSRFDPKGFDPTAEMPVVPDMTAPLPGPPQLPEPEPPRNNTRTIQAVIAALIVSACVFGCVALGVLAEVDPAIIFAVVFGAIFQLGFWGGIVLVVFATPIGLRGRQVIDRWDHLIPGGVGQREYVLMTVHEQLFLLRPPFIELEEVELSPGILRSMFGDTRPFLVIHHNANSRLRTYRMYLNVRDYGGSLQASWFLTWGPTWWQRLIRRTNRLQLDVFDEQDLRAYVTAVHHCFVQAVVELLSRVGQDSSKVNRSSSGFLGVS